MKKRELKNIIKECVREVILEEGMLSGIVSEVVEGLGTKTLVQESSHQNNQQSTKSHISSTRKKMLDAVAQNSYADVKKRFSNPEMFEGTRPLAEGTQKGALGGVAPSDPGVDISNIPGMRNWAAVASANRK